MSKTTWVLDCGTKTWGGSRVKTQGGVRVNNHCLGPGYFALRLNNYCISFGNRYSWY
jgi:hypothetical protein